MIEQAGVVVTVQGEYALVDGNRSTACGSCSARSGCGVSVLARVFGGRPVHLRALNRINARVGDPVVIGISEAGLLRGSMAVYLAPLAGLIVGALAGSWLGQGWSVLAGDAGALTGGCCGFVAGLVWLRRFSRRALNHPDYQPVILRKSGPETDHATSFRL